MSTRVQVWRLEVSLKKSKQIEEESLWEIISFILDDIMVYPNISEY